MIDFNYVPYSSLNSRQRENYNSLKLASILADYGYTCIRLTDDWNGADLIAHHIDGHDILIQLKGRFTVRHKYRGKRVWIAFPHDGAWFLFPHDEVQDAVVTRNPKAGNYSWPKPPKWALDLLQPYQLKVALKREVDSDLA